MALRRRAKYLLAELDEGSLLLMHLGMSGSFRIEADGSVDLVFTSVAGVALEGPNGSGKTTLLRIIAGEEPQDAGKVILADSKVLGYLPQNPQFDPDETSYTPIHVLPNADGTGFLVADNLID